MTGRASTAIQVGCQANAWQREFSVKDNLAEALRQMAAAGFQGAELPVWSLANLTEPGQVRELLAAHGLAFVAIHIGGTFYDATFREQTLPAARRAAACAAAAGAQGMVVSAAAKRAPAPPAGQPTAGAPAGGPAHVPKSAEELHLQTKHLRELAIIHRDLGLATYYHNHFTEFEHGEVELRSILDVEPSLLSLCFDIGNAARVLHGEALLETMRRHWSRIGYLHYKDIKGDTLAEALGDGELDFHAIGALVRELGFRGWGTAEIEPARGMVASRTVQEDARISSTLIRATLGLPT